MLCIQWGVKSYLTGNTKQDITLPITYDTSCSICIATRYVAGNYSSDVSAYGPLSKNKISVFINASGSGLSVCWFTIGY